MSGYSSRNRNTPNGAPQNVQRSYASQLKEYEASFHSYEHLQGLPRGDSALTMLRKVASMVKPVMRKRGWRVQILAEFLPPEQNLLGLNINRGYKICIRLRYHHNPDLFLPVEHVIDTMLHELSHNVWGDHDANFHRLWDELRDEQETLIRKGYTGEGFLSEGKKLGGGRVPPQHEMRRLARVNAEKRQAQNKLTKGSGQRLGGTPLHLYGSDVRNVIAGQATRRNTINKGCGSGRNDAVKLSDQAASNTFKTRAEEDDANNRAIAQALYELMEEEEDRKLKGTFSEPPTDGGLAWHPENGLYDPMVEEVSDASGHHRPHPSEEEQVEWALQDSMRSTQDNFNKWKQLSHSLPNKSSRTNSTPSNYSIEWKPSPVSATQPNLDSPVSPDMPEADSRPIAKRKRAAEGSTSNITSAPAGPALVHSPQETSPVIDLSEPFNPTTHPPDQWTCEICTCINPLQFLACDACGTERPQPIGIGNKGPKPKPRPSISAPAPAQNETLGWICTQCGSFMERQWWCCSACGKMKDSS